MATSLDENTSSDDDGYKGIDLISESDGDEPDVEAAEARNIIDSEEESTDGKRIRVPPSSPPPSVTSDWEGFDLDDDPFSANLDFMSDTFPPMNHLFHDEIESLTTANETGGQENLRPAESKRVRFRDDVLVSSDSSCSTSSDGDDHGFPDLFMQQDLLDPQFRRMIETEQDNDDGGSGSTDGEGSYWDLRGSDDACDEQSSIIDRHCFTGNHPQWLSRAPEGFDRHASVNGPADGDGHGSEGSSSGYESMFLGATGGCFIVDEPC
jgi:hypothetical protein